MVQLSDSMSLENNQLKLNFVNGLLTTIDHKALNQTFSVQQDFIEYNSVNISVSNSFVFQPNSTLPFTVLSNSSNIFGYQFINGSLYSAIIQTWQGTYQNGHQISSNVTHELRLYHQVPLTFSFCSENKTTLL